MITPRQSEDLRLLRLLRESPSFANIVATIEEDHEAWTYEARRPVDHREGDEEQRAHDLCLLLRLLRSECELRKAGR